MILANEILPIGAFPLPEPGRCAGWLTRVAQVDTNDPPRAVERFQNLLNSHGFPRARVSDPHWVSSFRIHRRVVDRFRVGCCLLAGDAAHIHSPAGGQGMNTDQEACNLAWKLGLIHAGVATDPEGLLDSYEAERRPIALDVLRGTGHACRHPAPCPAGITPERAGVVVPIEFIQQRISVGVSELGIDYRKSPIVAEDRPGPMGLCPFPGPRAGDRVPDVTLDRAANDGGAQAIRSPARHGPPPAALRGNRSTKGGSMQSQRPRGKSVPAVLDWCVLLV